MAINDEIPKSRLTLTYRTELDGERVEKALPFKMLVMGDLSLEKTRDAVTDAKERAEDLDKREIRMLNGTNLDTVMADMGMKISFTVPNRINSGDLPVELPIDAIKSFTPERIVEHVPDLKALVLFKKLLTELLGSIDNRKALRNSIRDFNNWRRHAVELPEQIAALQAERQAATDAVDQANLDKKISLLQTRQQESADKLSAFVTDFTAKLGNWDAFKLPAGG